MQEGPPVSRNAALGARNGLIHRMPARRLQLYSRYHGLDPVVVEPLLAQFKAGNNRVPAFVRVRSGMAARRTVTTANVTALCASPQMKPPAAGLQAFHAAISARLGRRLDPLVGRAVRLHRYTLAARDAGLHSSARRRECASCRDLTRNHRGRRPDQLPSVIAPT